MVEWFLNAYELEAEVLSKFNLNIFRIENENIFKCLYRKFLMLILKSSFINLHAYWTSHFVGNIFSLNMSYLNFWFQELFSVK